MTIYTALCGAVLLSAVVSVQSADKHSLFYIYTALSKPMDLPGIHEFTAMGLLDDRQIDYYDSEQQKKIPKQHWMEEKMQQDYWEKGTQSRKSKEQWFSVNVNILIDRMRQNKTDLHVLQWRHGCEVEKQGNDTKFFKGIDEYSYDGVNFLSFDDKQSQWVAPVDEALQTKRKWDDVPILNQYTKGYLEKECVDWLNKFREYGDQELKKSSPPEVYAFARKSVSDKSKLKLTCLATGFYPKDVTLKIRKYRTSLPEDQIASSGVLPNHDGTFQIRKSVEILEEEKADYDCYVAHRSLDEPIIIKWDGKCGDCNPVTGMGVIIVVVIGAVFVLVIALIGLYILKMKGIFPRSASHQDKKTHFGQNKGLLLNAAGHVNSTVIPVDNVNKPEEGERLLKDGSKAGSQESDLSDSGKESNCSLSSMDNKTAGHVNSTVIPVDNVNKPEEGERLLKDGSKAGSQESDLSDSGKESNSSESSMDKKPDLSKAGSQESDLSDSGKESNCSLSSMDNKTGTAYALN
ncbi:zinc-alpha-2-glycoprotein-like isoform X27 [Xyrauchen texanus]|uniref:zinc-alpha-2-glycoprotein-like isoform X24 n=1 Tax=Xyrauchen texanus TaxID=154827 RepID=UPI002242AF86|nr:zinc-alpha-2-glycoprotein-like isoform X24 [Xyrauchen texanus]XP_051980717.1 zinc-alpha-2-glycoprotein-like isoform X25 [Xyrauchen texanus]XP_051980718.1 zinc-alpha-2-glycoprotein-like isoform X26 [Xyrauchen texanus]XP_051980719.1 zinc-alpha-2-glycoprotein-like isoform X27 [Xyrauchen texanus]